MIPESVHVVLGERGIVWDLLIEAETGEPAPGHMHAQLVQQLALAGNAVQITEQQNTQKQFGINRGPSRLAGAVFQLLSRMKQNMSAGYEWRWRYMSRKDRASAYFSVTFGRDGRVRDISKLTSISALDFIRCEPSAKGEFNITTLSLGNGLNDWSTRGDFSSVQK